MADYFPPGSLSLPRYEVAFKDGHRDRRLLLCRIPVKGDHVRIGNLFYVVDAVVLQDDWNEEAKRIDALIYCKQVPESRLDQLERSLAEMNEVT